MGMLSWLFPSDGDLLADARALMAKGKYENARKKLMHCSLPEAEVLYEECSLEVDKALRVTQKKRLAADGFRGWKVEVTSSNPRVKKELEELIAKEVAKAGIDLTEPEVDQAALKVAIAKAEKRAVALARSQSGRAALASAGGAIKLVPDIDPRRKPKSTA